MGISLKLATNADIPVILEIEQSAGGRTGRALSSAEEWAEQINFNTVYIIQKDGVDAGYITFQNKGSGLFYLNGLAVRPEFRHQKIAVQSLRLVLEELKDAKKISVVVRTDDEGAINLYKSLGFAFESKKENFFGDMEHGYVFLLKP